MWTYPELRKRIQYVSFIGKSQFIPILIKEFSNQIVKFSKSKELAKRSCYETVHKCPQTYEDWFIGVDF